MSCGGVTVAYSGVHQAYQLALAAQEAGALDAFLCSVYDAPGKWGRMLRPVVGKEALVSRRIEGLDISRVSENPWPLLRQRLCARLRPGSGDDWLASNDAFDRWVAHKLERSSSRLFVGTETCALRAFGTCAQRGMARVLDCPQLHPLFLGRVLAEAADRLGLKVAGRVDSSGMADRKAREYALADRLLLYSEVHRRSFQAAGFAADRLFECPLWVDAGLWFRESPSRQPKPGPLRVLFVGGISLRKGVPFLLEAVKQLGRSVRLTLVGSVQPELQPVLAANAAHFELKPPQNKPTLRRTYADHDVLVLPSLGDSFGFVGLEAMACGLPVIVTHNCGVPVPDESWRVPVMDAEGLRRRLELYAADRGRLATDGERASIFAREFTPERYRRSIASVYRALLFDLP